MVTPLVNALVERASLNWRCGPSLAQCLAITYPSQSSDAGSNRSALVRFAASIHPRVLFGSITNFWSLPFSSRLLQVSGQQPLDTSSTPAGDDIPPPPPPPPPTPKHNPDDPISKLLANPALRDPVRKPRNPIVLCHGLYGFDVSGWFIFIFMPPFDTNVNHRSGVQPHIQSFRSITGMT